MKNELLHAVKTLQVLTSDSTYDLPLFVRVQTVNSRSMVGINSITIEDASVHISDDKNGELVFEIADLLALEGLKDSAGKPIFLKNFEGESTLAGDYANENDLLTQEANREAREWQESMLDIAGIEKGDPMRNFNSSAKSEVRNILLAIVASRVDDILDVTQSLKAA